MSKIRNEEIKLTNDFKPIKGFPDFYVNPEGIAGKLLPNKKLRVYTVDERGTCLLRDSENKARRKRQAHLVAEAFIPGYKKNQRIHFLDGNTHNGKLSNIYLDDNCEFSDEIWKDIPGYSNYEMSSKFRVRSKDRTQSVTLRNGDVYLRRYAGRLLSKDRGSRCMLTPDDGSTRSVNLKPIFDELFPDS